MKVLSIDQGTTSTRAFLVDEVGAARLVHSVEHRQIYPRPGWVEHDPEALIDNLKACIASGSAVGPIAAVGLDNQGESCLAWDAESGQPVGPIIVWQDNRTAADVEALRASGAEALTLERAGLPLDPYFSASKLGWILKTDPGARALAAAGRLRLGTTDAFFRQRLTGICATDPTTASRTSLFNIATGSWDDELCRLFGVPRETLAPIAPTMGALGEIASGHARLHLTASIVDQQAALRGHGCAAPGDAKITFGTGAFCLAVTGADLRRTDGGPLPTIAWSSAASGPTYALEGGVYAAAAAVNWARGLKLFNDYGDIEDFAAPPAISRGLAFVPALAGLACPHWDRRARGAFVGMSLDTGPADLVQAVLEGVAFRTAEVVAAIDKAQPLATPISIDGGMSRNPWFYQVLADTLGREISISGEAELTALGTAALAAEGAGHVLAPPHRGRRLSPRPRPVEWSERFSAARRAVQAFGAQTP